MTGSSGFPAPVLFGSSTSSWTFTPLIQDVSRALRTLDPSAAQRGAVN